MNHTSSTEISFWDNVTSYSLLIIFSTISKISYFRFFTLLVRNIQCHRQSIGIYYNKKKICRKRQITYPKIGKKKRSLTRGYSSANSMWTAGWSMSDDWSTLSRSVRDGNVSHQIADDGDIKSRDKRDCYDRLHRPLQYIAFTGIATGCVYQCSQGIHETKGGTQTPHIELKRYHRERTVERLDPNSRDITAGRRHGWNTIAIDSEVEPRPYIKWSQATTRIWKSVIQNL